MKTLLFLLVTPVLIPGPIPNTATLVKISGLQNPALYLFQETGKNEIILCNIQGHIFFWELMICMNLGNYGAISGTVVA